MLALNWYRWMYDGLLYIHLIRGAISIDQIPPSWRDEHCQKVLMGANLLEGLANQKLTISTWQKEIGTLPLTIVPVCIHSHMHTARHSHAHTWNTQWRQKVTELLYFSNHHHYHHHHHEMNAKRAHTHTMTGKHAQTPSCAHQHIHSAGHHLKTFNMSQP